MVRAWGIASLGFVMTCLLAISPGCSDSDDGAAAGSGPDASGVDGALDGSMAADARPALGDAAGAGDGGDGDDGGATPDPGFTIESPEIDVAPGQEIITCYYFQTTNTADVNVKTWKSTSTPGLGHVAVLLTATDRKAPGTVSPVDCRMVWGDANPASWAYSAFAAQDGWSFPADDGSGKPVGKPVKARQSGYLLLHAGNATAAAIKVRGTVEAVGHPSSLAITRAESYVTYDSRINVPGSSSAVATSTCATPSGTKFTWMSTLSRKSSTHTYVKDGAAVLFEGSDSQKPGASAWPSAPFGAFAGDQATVQCDYTNGAGASLTAGHSPNDETCMMLAYHFPASKPRMCVDDVLLP